jgi:hypothetical protein
MTFLIAFLGVFGAIWFVMTQLGGGGGLSGITRTVPAVIGL